MRLTRHTAGALVLALASLTALAEAPAAYVFLGRLTGDWRGTGEVSRMAGDMRMHWEPVLDGQFHRLSMENQLAGVDGKIWHFKAQGYYRVGTDGSITGQWFDSRGFSLPLTGSVTDDAMTIDWGTEASPERGRSTYRLAADALEVTDEVYGKDGKLSVFGRTRLTRGE